MAKSQADLNNHANQLNPNNAAFQGPIGSNKSTPTQADLNNHSNQLNPNNAAYSQSRAKKSK